MADSLSVYLDESGRATGLDVGVDYDVLICDEPPEAVIHMTDPEGKPLPNVLVRIWVADDAESAAQTFKADVNGVIRLRGFPDVPLAARVLAEGTANCEPSPQTETSVPAAPSSPSTPANTGTQTSCCDKCNLLQSLVDAGTIASKVRRGSTDKQAVSAFQYHLKLFGYSLGTSGPNGDGVDGGYGDRTAKALKAFIAQAGKATDANSDVLTADKAALVIQKCAVGFTGTDEQEAPPVTPSGPAGSMVKSSNIRVGGRPFATWFNDDFLPAENKKSGYSKKYDKLGATGFRKIFDQISGLTGKAETPLNEFIAHFFIMYSEIGPALEPVSEKGSAKYMFEPATNSKGVRYKVSYNGHANRSPGPVKWKYDQRYAGELLKEWGVITRDADYNAWNSRTTYPDKPPAATAQFWTTAQWENVKTRALECDFNKFRGRGLNQLTWRENYMRHADEALKQHYGKPCTELTTAELDEAFKDPKIYVPAFRSFNKTKMDKIGMVNQNPPQWKGYSKVVTGGELAGPLFEKRCNALLAAMTAAGYECF